MLDYKEMHFTMVRETEKAIRILIQAQQRCEEMYMEEEEGPEMDTNEASGPDEENTPLNMRQERV